jgi:trehalose 6-phosphate synthase/phosphatase
MNKLIIVSNRLPVSISGSKDNITINPTDGGLASAVGRVSQKLQARWIGYLGDQNDPDIVSSMHKNNFFPVNIPATTYKRYYNFFSNGVLWPVLHGLRPFASINSSWSAYVAANQAFADEVMEMVEEDDTIWIHDYHLFLLPELLRARGLTNKIGFFLHTPFPERSFFADTAQGRRILRSLMMTDSLGVQTNRYLERLRGAVRATGAMVNNSSPVIAYRNHIVKAGAFPIGIDYRYFSRKLDQQFHFMEKLQPKSDTKVVLSVSRLDYTKGIPELLEAVSKLAGVEHLKGKFVLRLNVIPSRETQREYQDLKHKIEQQVGLINKAVRNPNWCPVEYRYGKLAPDELITAYRNANIFVAASLADGMNLVAKEFLAANTKGVLVLGREAGAAEQLSEAFLVDSSDPADIARGLSTALTAPVPAKTSRHLRKIVRTQNVFTWAESFLATL